MTRIRNRERKKTKHSKNNDDLVIHQRKKTRKELDLYNSDEDVTNEEEKELESFLFGHSTDILEKKIELESHKEEPGNELKENEETDLLSFTISTKPSDKFTEVQEISTLISKPTKEERKPAWTDKDDIETSVDIQEKAILRKLHKSKEEHSVSGLMFQDRLKKQFEKIMPAPAWADVSNQNEFKEDEDDDDEDDIFKKTTNLLTKSEYLPKGILKINRVKDLNFSEPSDACITGLEFHPSAKIAFTSSMNKRLHVYQADGKENKKIQSIFLKSFPIYTAHFSGNGDKIVMASRRKFYYIYDLVGGKVIKIPEIRGREEKSLEKFVLSPDGELLCFLGSSGYLNLVSSKTNQWISSLKINNKVSSAMFSQDSSKLFTAGGDGEVYIWDVKSRRCQHKFVDEGSLNTTSIALSNNGQYIALGSSSGVVNVYDSNCFSEKHPKPVKSLMNLTTFIGGSNFNAKSEMLSYFSPQVNNAIKLVHFPSLTTFSNWPIPKQNLGNISCIDFSPYSGYLGIGNEQGKALLFRLSHYPDS